MLTMDMRTEGVSHARRACTFTWTNMHVQPSQPLENLRLQHTHSVKCWERTYFEPKSWRFPERHRVFLLCKAKSLWCLHLTTAEKLKQACHRTKISISWVKALHTTYTLPRSHANSSGFATLYNICFLTGGPTPMCFSVQDTNALPYLYVVNSCLN